MKPLLLAGHPALEFLNTTLLVHGTPTELIGEGKAFLEWMVAAGLMDGARVASIKRRFGAAELDAVAAEARDLRTWFAGWLSRYCAAPGADYESEIHQLNGLLRRGNLFRQLARVEGDVLAIVERPRLEDAGELIALVAAQVAELFSQEDPSLVKQCASQSCTLWFLDRTKAHRRRFCSPTVCGNREKVAAFRERQRQSS